MPVRDAAATIGAQLDALARQNYQGAWEVVLVDDGSRDDTLAVLRDKARRLPSARVVETGAEFGAGPGRARNAGAHATRGDFLAFCDADDVVAPGWLAALVHAAPAADLVAGRLDVTTLNSADVRAWHAAPDWLRLRPIHRFLPCASTANCGVWRDVFEALGGFEDVASVNEDKEFAWRAQLAGRTLRSAPDAVVDYRYRTTKRDTARQHFAWGLANPRLFRRFAGHGMRRTSALDVVRAWGWIVGGIALLPFSATHRGRWALRAAERAGHVVGSVRHRVVFL